MTWLLCWSQVEGGKRRTTKSSNQTPFEPSLDVGQRIISFENGKYTLKTLKLYHIANWCPITASVVSQTESGQNPFALPPDSNQMFINPGKCGGYLVKEQPQCKRSAVPLGNCTQTSRKVSQQQICKYFSASRPIRTLKCQPKDSLRQVM